VTSAPASRAASLAGSDPAAPAQEKAAIKALRKADPVLRQVIDEVGPLGDFFAGRPTDHYSTLVRSIVGQQLSTRAAAAIWNRLLDRFGGRVPTPEEVLADDPDELRTAAGLSHAKVKYLHSLAEHILGGSGDPARGDDPLRAAGDAQAGRGGSDRRALAAVPHARVDVPVAVAPHDAGVSLPA